MEGDGFIGRRRKALHPAERFGIGFGSGGRRSGWRRSQRTSGLAPERQLRSRNMEYCVAACV